MMMKLIKAGVLGFLIAVLITIVVLRCYADFDNSPSDDNEVLQEQSYEVDADETYFVVTQPENTNYLFDLCNTTTPSEVIPQEESESAIVPDEPEIPYNLRYVGILDDIYTHIDELAKIVCLETGYHQPQEGVQAVVEVILNRVIDERFPNTVMGVLSAPGQFSTYCRINQAVPEDFHYQAIYDAISNETNVLPEGVVYFARGALTQNVYGVIGDHTFCY